MFEVTRDASQLNTITMVLNIDRDYVDLVYYRDTGMTFMRTQVDPRGYEEQGFIGMDKEELSVLHRAIGKLLEI